MCLHNWYTHLSSRSRVNEGSLLLLEYIRAWSREAGGGGENIRWWTRSGLPTPKDFRFGSKLSSGLSPDLSRPL